MNRFQNILFISRASVKGNAPGAGMILLTVQSNQIPKLMRTILYLIALILVIGWILGAFVYNAGQLIHILLVIAIVSLLLGFIRRGRID